MPVVNDLTSVRFVCRTPTMIYLRVSSTLSVLCQAQTVCLIQSDCSNQRACRDPALYPAAWSARQENIAYFWDKSVPFFP